MMSLMSTEQVAEFLGVKVERVKRLSRESLLIAKAEDENGEPAVTGIISFIDAPLD